MEAPLLSPQTPSFNAYRIVLDNLLDEIEQQWSMVRETPFGGPLHDVRIGVRNARAVLSQSKKILDKQTADDGRAGLTWLGHATNTARDIDVILASWEKSPHHTGPDDLLHLAPIRIELEQRLRAEQTLLQSDHYNTRVNEFIQGWRNSLHTAEPGPKGMDWDTEDAVNRHLTSLRDDVLRIGKSLSGKSPDADIHKLRRRAKRLRYYAENFSSVLDPEPTEEFLKQLRRVQDTLGTFQDVCIHIALVESALEAVMTTSPNGISAAAENLTNQLLESKATSKKKTLKRFDGFRDYCTSHTWCIGSWSK